MKKSLLFKRGFSLIELLIVIAILGILTAIVLPSLNSARGKGKDSKVKSELDSLRAQAELYSADNGNTYTDLFIVDSWDSADPQVKSILDSIAIDVASGLKFANSDVDYWVATAQLPSTIGTTTAFWCVDNKGTSKLWEGASDPDDTVAECE